MRPQRDSPWRGPRTQPVLAALVVFVATVSQLPAARFVHDAATYWAGSVSLTRGGDFYVDGVMSLRGVWTSALYLPAALATRVLGDSSGGVAVLVENSLLVSFVGVLLLPWLLRAWVPVTAPTVWLCAGLTWLCVGRLAPYPLVDLWAAAVILAAVVALQRRTAIGLAGAGLLAGIAFNIRPAYLLPLVLTVAVLFLRHRLAALWFAAGVVLALAPQSVVNLWQGTGWKPWPSDMLALTQLQAYYAAFVVRYDTVNLPGRDPQLFFCHPFMAQAVGDHPPQSTAELAVVYLHHLPQSLVFVAEKVAAALHWPLSLPYFAPTGAGDQIFALLITVVAVLGAVSLLWAQYESGFRSAPVEVWAALAVWTGSLITIVTSTPETRFALPLVLIGITGCGAVAGRLAGRWVVVALTAVALLFAVGAEGLSHPAAPGLVSPATCAAR